MRSEITTPIAPAKIDLIIDSIDKNQAEFTRSKWLFDQNFAPLSRKKVLVCGLGGVGGIAASALIRAGVEVNAIDCDTFDATNKNRQIHSEFSGKKAAVFAALYNISCFDFRIDYENFRAHLERFSYDLVLDCIDDVAAKVAIAKLCARHKIKLISSGGAARKIDASRIKIANWDKTSGCGLARAVRTRLKQENFKAKFDMIYSDESAICVNLGSFMGVTAAFGATIASRAIVKLLTKEKQ